MRKIFILVIALSINIVAFAQRTVHTQPNAVTGINSSNFSFGHNNTYSRTTGLGDTLVLTNILAADTPLVIYSAGISDSGYLTGTDVWGDQGFAERYDFDNISGVDSSLVIIGVVAQFHGSVNPLSTNTVTFNAWDVGFPLVVSATTAYSGFPNDNMDSLVVPFTQLGIGATGDTIKPFLFPAATIVLQNGFFIGYTMNYNFLTLSGDTIGLACSANGDRTSPAYTVQTYIDSVLNMEGTADSAITVTDTTINVQNATQWSDGVWHDNYTNNDSISNDLAIYPIVVIGSPTSVKGVKKNNFTFFGNFPNPAVNTTNIRFSLLKNADVTVQILDMNGRIISTITDKDLTVGEHTIPVNTSTMAAGDYLYLIHTSGGDGVASKMTIVK